MIYQCTELILVVPVHITVNFVFQFSLGYLMSPPPAGSASPIQFKITNALFWFTTNKFVKQTTLREASMNNTSSTSYNNRNTRNL